MGKDVMAGKVSKSMSHDLLYIVLELFESALDSRLQADGFRWSSWLEELVSVGDLNEVQTGKMPEIENVRGDQQ